MGTEEEAAAGIAAKEVSTTATTAPGCKATGGIAAAVKKGLQS